ncbi:hypothetical protein BSNK01_01170 [Bacillaceae bacterium]
MSRPSMVPPMTREEAETFLQQLVAEGLLKEEERWAWETMKPERLKRLYDGLNQRTRYVSIVLEAVHDSHNQAAVLRSADAFGIQDVYIVAGDTSFSPNRKVTQSAHKWLTILRRPDIRTTVLELKRKGYRVYASDLSKDAVPVDQIDLSKPTALLFGNEQKGLSEEAFSQADGTFVVPMHGFVQSLNISVAAAVTLYEVTKRARKIAKERYYLLPEEKQKLFREWFISAARPRIRNLLKMESVTVNT